MAKASAAINNNQLIINSTKIVETIDNLKKNIAEIKSNNTKEAGVLAGSITVFDPNMLEKKKKLTAKAKMVAGAAWVTMGLIGVNSVWDVIVSCANSLVGDESASVSQIYKRFVGRKQNFIFIK